MREPRAAEGLSAPKSRFSAVAAAIFRFKSRDWRSFVYQSRFLGRGSDEALFSEKKGVFSEKGGGIQ